MFLCCGSSLTILQKAFRQNAKFGLFFFAHISKVMKRLHFLKKNLKAQNILLEPLNSVLMRLMETFAESTKICSQKLEKVKRYMFFFAKSYSKRSLGHVESHFDKPDEVFLPRSRNIFWSMKCNDQKD